MESKPSGGDQRFSFLLASYMDASSRSLQQMDASISCVSMKDNNRMKTMLFFFVGNINGLQC